MNQLEIARAAGKILADRGPTHRLRDGDILETVIAGHTVRVFWPDAAEDCGDPRIVITYRRAEARRVGKHRYAVRMSVTFNY